MKDLVETIVKGFFRYLPVLISVTTTPKSSILALITNESDRLNKAFTFCFYSIAIGFVLQAPILKADQDFVIIAGSLLVIKILAILTFAGIILFGFRLVGGKGDFETTLCAGLYITSPIYLFIVVTYIIGIGILSTHDPELATSWRSGQTTPETIEAFTHTSPILAVSFSVLVLSQFLISIIWFIICWGTYRAIHHLSWIKSVLVYLFAIFVWYIYWILIVLIMKGLNNGVLSPIV